VRPTVAALGVELSHARYDGEANLVCQLNVCADSAIDDVICLLRHVERDASILQAAHVLDGVGCNEGLGGAVTLTR
jgi:hypothetical protein